MKANWPLKKLEEAASRKYFKTVDLFAGCGGLSLGFHRANFQCICALEINPDARASHCLNFSGIATHEGYAAHSNIEETSPQAALSHIPLRNIESKVDVIIGGPPCQAFSRLGRAALWRIAGKDFAHAHDERATMYHHFISYVAALKPVAFVMENVREMGKFVGRNLAEEIAETMDTLGYETRYALLNAVWFGVPQLRERMFIIGIRKELGITPSFPKIAYDYELPVGYSTSRSGMGRPEVLSPHDHYVDHAVRSRILERAVTASDAFADLPPIYEHLDGKLGKGNRRDTSKKVKYLDLHDNCFTRAMKGWPGFESEIECAGHVIRYTPRDYEIFRRMNHGDMYPQALEVAKEIFSERLGRWETKTGIKLRKGSKEWNELYKSTVPPYKVHRYPNKFRKMWPDHPSRTLPAHIGKDSYSHIHFDSEQARTISLREAARIQSFPDGFQFAGSMNSQLKQIGNAVPPLLSYAVAKCLQKDLLSAYKKTL